MGALLGLLSNPLVVVLVLAIAGLGGAYRIGAERASARAAIEQEKRDQGAFMRARARSSETAELVARERQQFAAELADYEQRMQALKGKVPQYVPPKANAGCVITRGFVQLHDAAADGGLPGLPAGAGGSVTESAGVSLAEVGAAIADNYGACGAIARETAAWRKWYATQSTRWADYTGAAAAKPAGQPQTKGTR